MSKLAFCAIVGVRSFTIVFYIHSWRSQKPSLTSGWCRGFSPNDAIVSCACYYSAQESLASNWWFACVRAKHKKSLIWESGWWPSRSLWNRLKSWKCFKKALIQSQWQGRKVAMVYFGVYAVCIHVCLYVCWYTEMKASIAEAHPCIIMLMSDFHRLNLCSSCEEEVAKLFPLTLYLFIFKLLKEILSSSRGRVSPRLMLLAIIFRRPSADRVA